MSGSWFATFGIRCTTSVIGAAVSDISCSLDLRTHPMTSPSTPAPVASHAYECGRCRYGNQAIPLAKSPSQNCCRAADAGRTIDDIAGLICRGGWPRMIGMVPTTAQARLRDYLDDIARTDISRVAGVRRNPRLASGLLISLARNEATSATYATLQSDMSAGGNGPADSTLRAYLDELTRLFVIEPLEAWSVHLRSTNRLRRTPKRYFADPALAVAALASSPVAVSRDFRAMGMLFESMAVRDLRVYAQSAGGHVYYYGDHSGLEADAVIEGLDGRWAAIEVKLGGAAAVREAMESLRTVRSRVDTSRLGEPARLIIVTAFGPGYQTDDGVAVVPLTALRP